MRIANLLADLAIGMLAAPHAGVPEFTTTIPTELLDNVTGGNCGNPTRGDCPTSGPLVVQSSVPSWFFDNRGHHWNVAHPDR